MRRGGCARRAMLGAVAAGALLGAARGYEITLDTKANANPVDDEYKVVTAAGLEIVIGPKVSSVYDITPAVPDGSGLAVGVAVEGGKNAINPSSCPGGIALSNGNIVCYDGTTTSRGAALVTNASGSLTVANAVNNVAERTAFDT